jgi:hypothetical protein
MSTTATHRKQENRDALRLLQWQQDVKDNNGRCPIAVQNYLDIKLPGWRECQFREDAEDI